MVIGMSKRFLAASLLLVIASGVTALAIEKPTKEFQDIMRSNSAIVDLVGGANGALGRGTNVDGPRGAVEAPSIRVHLAAKDFDALVKDAATLKSNFATLQAFWTERKVDDAIGFSTAGAKAVSDLDTAARAQDSVGVAKAQVALADTCRGCHLAHRVIMLTEQAFQIR
jgi:cytochrome c556